jgi:rare lipoprotein A
MRGLIFLLALAVFVSLLVWGFLETTPTEKSTPIDCGTVVCSWYGPGFDDRLTANGEIYHQDSLTFAHRTLPFGTRVRFIREIYTPYHWEYQKVNGVSDSFQIRMGRTLSVVGRCSDRGPYINGRTFDLSRAMACSLGMLDKGIDAVEYEVVK